MDDLELYEQFKDLSLRFPKLRLEKSGLVLGLSEEICAFQPHSLDVKLMISILLKIIIPEKYSDVLPKVQETDNRIPRDFHHYQDDSLCLGAPIAVKYKFKEEPTLVGFVSNCVIPYLYSFSYKIKFGKMPFGELSHGTLGILEHYKDLFDLTDSRRVIKMIQILAEDNYHEHNRCPCGRGKRLRSCHGKLLLELKTLQSPAEFHSEYNLIIKHFVAIAFQNPYRSHV